MNVLALTALALAVAAPASKEAPKKVDPPPIVGVWECVEVASNGEVASAEDASSCGLEFAADGTHRFRWGGQVGAGTFTTDQTKEPAQLDFGSDKGGRINFGIYKVEKDTLIVCFTENGGTRPTKFEYPAGTRIVLLKLKRVEKAKE
jgi:uncharacterized protein (TIGR03067 family)